MWEVVNNDWSFAAQGKLSTTDINTQQSLQTSILLTMIQFSKLIANKTLNIKL